MMFSEDDFNATVADISKLERQFVDSEFGNIPASVGYLEDRIAKATTADERISLYDMLTSLCSAIRNDGLHIAVLRRAVKDMPDHALSWVGLAYGIMLIEPENKASVVPCAKKAVEAAKSRNQLVRHCLAYLARLAIQVDDYDALKFALEESIADAEHYREEDTRYEFDFVDHIEISRIDPALVQRYKALA